MSNTIIVSAPGPQGPAGTGGAGGVTDGDKGSIVVTNSGTTWTLDTAAVATANIADDAVTFGKIQNITGPTILGRQNASAGSVEQIGLAAAFTINGSKQLDLANALAASSTTLTAGTGLTGGGDLSANRTFAVAYGTTSGTACQGNDSRLSDARTPTAHTHALSDIQQGGATSGQVLEWSGTAWAPASITGGGGGTVTSVTAGDGLLGGTITASGTIDCNFGTAGNTVCEGNDARLSDARTPTAHNHAATEITSGTLDIARIPTGTSSTTVCIGNDARLSDARTPTAHNHAASEITSGALDIARIPTGSTASTVCIGNDARLSDARTPTAHTHALADLTQSGATSGQVPTWNGSAWAPATPSGGGGGAPAVTQKYVNLEHFEHNTATPREMVLSVSNGSVGNSFEIGRVGVVNIATGSTAVANSHATWRLQNSSTPHDFSAVSSAKYSTLIKGLNLGDGTTTGFVFCGIARLSAPPGSDPTNGVYFRATDGGNWYAVTRASNTETATDTGVSQSTSLWRRLTAKYTASSCTFYVDGALVATHTTNIPTAELNYGMSVVKTAAVTSQIRYQVDYLYIEHTYANAVVVD